MTTASVVDTMMELQDKVGDLQEKVAWCQQQMKEGSKDAEVCERVYAQLEATYIAIGIQFG